MSKNNDLSIMEINQAAPKFQDMSIAPMHTAEHILNRTMQNMFNCGRSVNAHIERKKSKCDYLLAQPLTGQQIQEIENCVNGVIRLNLAVRVEYMSKSEAAGYFDMNRLPEDAGETLRLVYVGEFDVCPCIGLHVENTGEIGTFIIISSDFSDGKLRLRYKLIPRE